MKIYDSFIFHNENDLIELRLDLLYPYVDYFIVVEGKQNHRGKDKSLNFLSSRITQYMDRIRYFAVDLPDYGSDDIAASKRENYQRNCIAQGLFDADPNDLILFGDADEIADPRLFDFIELVTRTSPVIKLQQYLSYFKLNYRGVGNNRYWYGTTAARHGQLSTLEELRNLTIQNVPFVPNAGWHASYCGPVDFIVEKMDSFCHADAVRQWNTGDNIHRAIASISDPFHRDIVFEKESIDDTYPPNIKRFNKLYD